MRRVQPIVKSYDWGMTHPVSCFMEKKMEKIAELWWGSHPSGCFLDKKTLEPIHHVPFLLKLLFVEKPLSLQVHPNPEQVKQYNFPDPLPKPEIIIATTTFEALCGFLNPEQVVDNISTIPLLCKYLDFQDLFECHDLPKVLDSARQYSLKKKHEPPYSIFLSLLDIYPNDPATLAPFYMNYIRLTKGQALVIPGSQPHCYLSGQGIECMPCSDNIVRCGLTTKVCNIDLFFQMCIPQPICIQTIMFNHPSFNKYFSLHQKPCFGKKHSVVLILQGEGYLNNIWTKEGDSWLLETDQPILFTEGSLKVMIAMPCTDTLSK